jgi:hypothetical protein
VYNVFCDNYSGSLSQPRVIPVGKHVGASYPDTHCCRAVLSNSQITFSVKRPEK